MRFAIALLVLAACNKEGPGPIQRAGAWVDDAAEKTGHAAENAGAGISSAFRSDAGTPAPAAVDAGP